ncbi:YncE family protein [Paracoccus sp. MBLB3053]|uniref:YncE family protein n=1 Tax=Paracoccus aurantius TaxID=3073814 RepID=A0ABU2HQH2_9RHOB|nr:YncE family protein [Paracoccus sp. MBLB3053]MDS9466839.1 YncE family protein [Paracoccus sp. MBLB3053]
MAGPASAADLAFVTSQNAQMLSVVDLDSGDVLARTELPGAPAPVAYDPSHSRAYAISAETGVLSVIDEAGTVLRSKHLPTGAFGIATAPDGYLFVTEWYQGRLMKLDAELNVLWSVPTGHAPAGVATDGKLVATADRDDDRISIFDAVSGKLKARVTVGKHPYAVVIHDGRIWSADVQSNTVSVIDLAEGKLIGQIPTGSHPYGIAFAKGLGFVTDQYAGTVTVFDAGSLEPMRTIETGDYPEGIAPLPDGSGVVVAHWDSNTLVWIDATSLAITREIELPDGPRAFGRFTGRQQ